MLNNNFFHPTDVYPDGLTPDLIDALTREVADALTETAASLRLSRSVLDGTAVERRERRQARRTLTAVVRALPGGDPPDREVGDGDNDAPMTGAAIAAVWGGAA